MATTADDLLAALYAAADDYEAETLDRLRVRAGLLWRHEGCWLNPEEAATCERCGTPRVVIEATGNPPLAALRRHVSGKVLTGESDAIEGVTA